MQYSNRKLKLLKCNFLFREKKLLASSEDYGKDLTGVQNLRRKHQRLEVEIHNHEPKVLVSREAG
jgi:spectrin alpha